jgi:hypothetical protein
MRITKKRKTTHTLNFTNRAHLFILTFSPLGRMTTSPSSRRSTLAMTSSPSQRTRSVRVEVPVVLSLYIGMLFATNVVFRIESAERTRKVCTDEGAGATSVRVDSFGSEKTSVLEELFESIFSISTNSSGSAARRRGEKIGGRTLQAHD